MFTKEKRDKQLQIRLTEKEKNLLVQLAKEKDMNVTQFIFYLIQNYLENK